MNLVIGGTGTTGRLVARGLRGKGHPARTAGRRRPPADVRFDWYDEATWSGTLDGVRAVYVIPPVGDVAPERVVLPFLRRAAGAGVRRAVLLSSSAIGPGDDGVGLIHRRLGECFEQWAVLRPSWFMENFVGAHPQAAAAREHGEIVSATGDGRVGFVDPADIAAVAVHALTDATPHNSEHIITGPETLSYDDVAAILSAVGGRPVRHRAVPGEELTRRLVTAGIPAEFATMLVAMDTAIAAGSEDRVTPTVATVTGRPPRSFRDFCTDRLR